MTIYSASSRSAEDDCPACQKKSKRKGGVIRPMWFWWFMFIGDLSIPLLMIFAGRMMWKHMPKNINGIVGYRTKRSMENMDTWRFANEYCGRLWYKIGWIVFFPSAVLHVPFYGRSIDAIAILGAILCTIQVTILLASIVPVEHALKKYIADSVDGSSNTL